MVTSTTGLMGRNPARRSRSRSHSGVVAFDCRCREPTRPANLRAAPRAPQFAPGTVTGCDASRARTSPGTVTASAGERRDFARDAEHRHGIAAVRRHVRPRAPLIKPQVLAQGLADRAHRPAARECRSRPPPARAPWPSTACPATRRRAASPPDGLARPGASAPTVASALFSPARAFGAPQTICSASSDAAPCATRQTCSLSACGMPFRATGSPPRPRR